MEWRIKEASNASEESLTNLIAGLKLHAERVAESIEAASLLDKRRQLDPDEVSFFLNLFTFNYHI
jgi:hypothetical protein